MRIFQRGIIILDIFLFSSLFIALCAVCMVYQTYYLFHQPDYNHFIWFAFFGTLCSYNFHWYLTPALYGGSYRTKWSVKYKKLHLSLYIIALAGCGWFCFQLLAHWRWLLATAFITFLYSAPKIPFPPFNHLKKIAIGKTIFLTMVWTHTTVVLPLLIQEIKWRPEHLIFTINRFFLIYAICILFDYRDREDDKKQGIKSMITLFNEKGVNKLFYLSIVICMITTAALYLYSMRLFHCIALIAPAILLTILYNYSKKNTSDYFYYFFLDGLMMFSAILIFLFQF